LTLGTYLVRALFSDAPALNIKHDDMVVILWTFNFLDCRLQLVPYILRISTTNQTSVGTVSIYDHTKHMMADYYYWID
jgi:hypothetical protein